MRPLSSERDEPSLKRQVLPLHNLNAIRILIVLMIGFGYASTMPIGPGSAEWGRHLSYDPSWFGLQILFFLSGLMAWRSLSEGRTGWTYLRSLVIIYMAFIEIYTIVLENGRSV